MKNKYDQQNISTLEMIYGEGYLSAGGDSEVTAVIDGIDLADKSVLDIGCGLGGAAITMARDHSVASVHGIDIDASVLERATYLVGREKLNDKITLTLVEPGPIPFDDNQFDLAYATAVTCHLRDLSRFFIEVFRVIKPGSSLVGCEWFKIKENAGYQKWDNLLRDRGLNFYFLGSEEFSSELEKCGFKDVSIVDRTQVITEIAVSTVDRVDNELKANLVDTLGNEGYQTCRNWTAIRMDALMSGGIGQGHFRATKPI